MDGRTERDQYQKGTFEWTRSSGMGYGMGEAVYMEFFSLCFFLFCKGRNELLTLICAVSAKSLFLDCWPNTIRKEGWRRRNERRSCYCWCWYLVVVAVVLVAVVVVIVDLTMMMIWWLYVLFSLELFCLLVYSPDVFSRLAGLAELK